MYKLHLGMDVQDNLFTALDNEVHVFNDTQDFSWKTTMKRSARLGMIKKQAKEKNNENI